MKSKNNTRKLQMKIFYNMKIYKKSQMIQYLQKMKRENLNQNKNNYKRNCKINYNKQLRNLKNYNKMLKMLYKQNRWMKNNNLNLKLIIKLLN